MESAKTLRRHRAAQGNFLRYGVRQALYFSCGVLTSRGAVLGTLAPFGASFTAAVPKEGLIASFLGATLGYIILSPADSFRYIAVMIAIGGVRWLFSDLGKIAKSRLFAPLAAFIPIFATGVALLFSSGSTLSEFTGCSKRFSRLRRRTLCRCPSGWSATGVPSPPARVRRPPALS